MQEPEPIVCTQYPKTLYQQSPTRVVAPASGAKGGSDIQLSFPENKDGNPTLGHGKDTSLVGWQPTTTHHKVTVERDS